MEWTNDETHAVGPQQRYLLTHVRVGVREESQKAAGQRKNPALKPPLALVNDCEGITSASVAFIAGARSL